jgi:hypothetical protein
LGGSNGTLDAALVQFPGLLTCFQPKVVANKLNQEGIPLGRLSCFVDEVGEMLILAWLKSSL